MKSKKIKGLIFVIVLLTGTILALDCGVILRQVESEASDFVLMLDPGHGGMDGGAVSSDGAMEKDVNLAIAKEVRSIAESYGWQVIMTRETDQWLCETEEGSIRARKTEDLKARREMIRSYSPQVAISIHLNSFTEDPSVRGLQVFYPSSGGDEAMLGQCKSFAEILTKNLTATLDIQKERTPMTKDDVFIFKEVVCPIVIIECGFMSNPQEAELLQTREYQRKLAQGIIAGVVDFTGVEKAISLEIIDSLD